jgi:hypothetical protein
MSYADPPILDWLDSIAAACIRAPSWCRRLLALGHLQSLIPATISAPTAIVLLADTQYLLLLPPGAVVSLALTDEADGTITVGSAHTWITTTAATTLTITPTGTVSCDLVVPASAQDRVVVIESEHQAVSAPRLILSPPAVTASLDADQYWELAAEIVIGLLGDGNPAGGGTIADRRYEISSLGSLSTDLAEQCDLGLMRWQITQRDQDETMGIDPTSALRGRYLGLLTIAAEGTA